MWNHDEEQESLIGLKFLSRTDKYLGLKVEIRRWERQNNNNNV